MMFFFVTIRGLQLALNTGSDFWLRVKAEEPAWLSPLALQSPPSVFGCTLHLKGHLAISGLSCS